MSGALQWLLFRNPLLRMKTFLSLSKQTCRAIFPFLKMFHKDAFITSRRPLRMLSFSSRCSRMWARTLERPLKKMASLKRVSASICK